MQDNKDVPLEKTSSSGRAARRSVLYKYLDDNFIKDGKRILFTIGRIKRDLSEEIARWGELYNIKSNKNIDSELSKLLDDYGVEFVCTGAETMSKRGRPQNMYRAKKENSSESRKVERFNKKVEALKALKESSDKNK